MGYGYPPHVDKLTKWKYYLPIVLRTQTVITARIRKMGEGNSLSLLVCPQGEGSNYPGQVQGTPPPPSQGTYPPSGYPPRTCYTAGGMPLVFTQEDFLVSSHANREEKFLFIFFYFSIFQYFWDTWINYTMWNSPRTSTGTVLWQWLLSRQHSCVAHSWQ